MKKYYDTHKIEKKVYDKICANLKCKTSFQTNNPRKIFCGSFAKKVGCSYFNQREHTKIWLK